MNENEWPRRAEYEAELTAEQIKETFLEKLVKRGHVLKQQSAGTRRAMSEFGKTIRALRRMKNLSQSELAKRAGLHPSFISFLESGDLLEEELRLEVLEGLAGALKTPRILLESQLNYDPIVEPSKIKKSLQSASEKTAKVLRQWTERDRYYTTVVIGQAWLDPLASLQSGMQPAAVVAGLRGSAGVDVRAHEFSPETLELLDKKKTWGPLKARLSITDELKLRVKLYGEEPVEGKAGWQVELVSGKRIIAGGVTTEAGICEFGQLVELQPKETFISIRSPAGHDV